MSRLILQMQMSVDGYMSAETDIDWQVWNWSDPWTWDKGLKRRFNAVFDAVGCILLSRKMAEQAIWITGNGSRATMQANRITPSHARSFSRVRWC